MKCLAISLLSKDLLKRRLSKERRICCFSTKISLLLEVVKVSKRVNFNNLWKIDLDRFKDFGWVTKSVHIKPWVVTKVKELRRLELDTFSSWNNLPKWPNQDLSFNLGSLLERSQLRFFFCCSRIKMSSAGRKSIIYLFRNDLRVHDNECLKWANNNADFVVPLYCFDPGTSWSCRQFYIYVTFFTPLPLFQLRLEGSVPLEKTSYQSTFPVPCAVRYSLF